MPVRNVRLAKDPLRTVAKGSLVAAISMEKKKLSNQPKADNGTKRLAGAELPDVVDVDTKG